MKLDSNLADASETQRPTRDPLAALWHPKTTHMRCAAIAKAVESGASAWFKLNKDAWPALVQSTARAWQDRPAAAAAAAEPYRQDELLGPSGSWRLWAEHCPERWARLREGLAAKEGPDVACRAQLDLAVIAALMSASVEPAWTWQHIPGQTTPAIALPVQRQQRDDLLAMLDQASGTASGAPTDVALPDVGKADAAVEAVSAEEASPAMDSAGNQSLPGLAGLNAAVLQAFTDGVFSDHADDALRVDARALTRLDLAAARAIFQGAQGGTPLAGLEARVELLQRLGALLEELAASSGDAARPSMLLDDIRRVPGPCDAEWLMRHLSSRWARIWPQGSRVLGLPAGDVRPHRWAGAQTADGPDAPTADCLPLHHPVHRLLFSLLDPLHEAGVAVSGLHALAAGGGVQEGHIFLANGIIVSRQSSDFQKTWSVGDELVTEWRALTIHLMDVLAQDVRATLGLQPEGLPAVNLAAVLNPKPAAPDLRVAPDGVYL